MLEVPGGFLELYISLPRQADIRAVSLVDKTRAYERTIEKPCRKNRGYSRGILSLRKKLMINSQRKNPERNPSTRMANLDRLFIERKNVVLLVRANPRYLDLVSHY